MPNARGFGHLVLIIALLVGIVVSAGITKTLLNKRVPNVKNDEAYTKALVDFQALKGKAKDYEMKGATVSAVLEGMPSLLSLIKDNKLTEASTQIASLSAQLDRDLSQKLEADRIASEASKKKAEEEAAKKKAEEEARRKAQEAAARTAATPKPAPQPVVQPLTPPTTSDPPAGYSRISVATDRGTFTVDMIKADIGGGTKVITDSGNTTDCADGCIALPLTDYINRNGGYAGMNGAYFCPPDYSFCNGKVNSTNFFVFNYQAKTFLNADKRDYSNAGSAFVFRNGSVQFYRDPRAFGLDTSITGAIACFPTLTADGQIVLNDAVMDDKQRTVKGARSALGNSGNTVFLVIARAATVPDMAAIMQSLGAQNSINLDGGGSVAMYNGGYKVGPGRALPTAIILAR